ncbi:MAG: hypothetical protein ABJB01_06200 [Rudaea sp.]
MRSLIVLLAVTLAALATGCATMGNNTVGKAMTFDCSGAGHGWDECTQKAQTACGAKGFDVVKRNIDSQSTSSGTSEMKRELQVSCK